MTTQPRTELRAEAGQAWVRADDLPPTRLAKRLRPPRRAVIARASEQRTSYREVFAIAILVYCPTHSAFVTALAYALTYPPPIAAGRGGRRPG